jgi:hypothetical protein
MPNTGLLMLGAMGLLYLMRGQGAGTQKPGTLANLLGADMSSSGVGSFGGAETNLNARTLSTAANVAILSGNTKIEAMAVDATSGIPIGADLLQPAAPEIAGTLSALFEAQGVTVSELSGAAVRQVGLGRFDQPDLQTSNYPQIAFIQTSVDGVQGSPFEIDDEPIQVLAPVNRDPVVVTIAGNDGTTTVTTMPSIIGGYFSTGNAIVAAINEGYFDAPTPYVPRTIIEIEQEWAESPAGLASREAAQASTAEAYAYVAASQDNWWGEG